LFGKLHNNKQNLRILEYALSPTTLEQIFHSFALEQTSEDLAAADQIVEGEGNAPGAGKLDDLATLVLKLDEVNGRAESQRSTEAPAGMGNVIVQT